MEKETEGKSENSLRMTQPLMRCKECGCIMEAIECPKHQKLYKGHDTWDMVKRKRIKKQAPNQFFRREI